MIGIKDGHLVTEFCANRADSIASLNFKRAIASLFQVVTANGEYVSTINSIIYCTLLHDARLGIFFCSFDSGNNCHWLVTLMAVDKAEEC